MGKDLLESKTFWGAVVVALGLVLSQFGIHISVGPVASAIVTLIGIAYTVVGRVTSTVPVNSILGIKLKGKANEKPVS